LIARKEVEKVAGIEHGAAESAIESPASTAFTGRVMMNDQILDTYQHVNPLSPLSDPFNGALKRPHAKANSSNAINQ
jgi:hypothetical protein